MDKFAGSVPLPNKAPHWTGGDPGAEHVVHLIILCRVIKNRRSFNLLQRVQNTEKCMQIVHNLKDNADTFVKIACLRGGCIFLRIPTRPGEHRSPF